MFRSLSWSVGTSAVGGENAGFACDDPVDLRYRVSGAEAAEFSGRFWPLGWEAIQGVRPRTFSSVPAVESSLPGRRARSDRVEVDLDDLADMLSVIADGGIIISKAIKDKQVLARQMLLYRDFIKAVFLGVPSS